MPNANVVIVVDRAYSQGTYIRTGAITGRALNNTPDQFSYAQITFGIYQNDAKYGSCLANTSYLDSGATWKFEASCINVPDGTWQYKVEGVTYW